MHRVLPLAVLLSACEINEDARVAVTYDQLANFGIWSVGTTLVDGATTGTDGLPRTFVMYRILSVDNTGLAAASFTFSEDNVVTVTSAKTLNEDPGPANEAALLQDAWVGTPVIPAGELQSTALGCFVKEAAGVDRAETEGLIDLLHVVVPTQPVDLIRAGGDATTVLLDGFQTNQELINLCKTAPTG